MGLHHVICPSCKKPHQWFSGNLDNRCMGCRQWDDRSDLEIMMGHIKNLVEEQANDESLWAEPIDRLRTIHEEIVLKALRRLHARIEGDKEAEEFYSDNGE